MEATLMNGSYLRNFHKFLKFAGNNKNWNEV